jgi:hypothetical protein
VVSWQRAIVSVEARLALRNLTMPATYLDLVRIDLVELRNTFVT